MDPNGDFRPNNPLNETSPPLVYTTNTTRLQLVSELKKSDAAWD